MKAATVQITPGHLAQEADSPMPSHLTISRFLQKLAPQEDGCWLWTAATAGGTGYGSFHDGTKRLGAHRFAYELWRGPIPEGLELDHVCQVRPCVNPDHLRAVTHAAHMANHLQKDVCIRGHRLDHSKRNCLACERVTRKQRRHSGTCEICGITFVKWFKAIQCGSDACRAEGGRQAALKRWDPKGGA